MKRFFAEIGSALLLAPLAGLYDIVTRLRNLCFDLGIFSIYRSSLPVVSVGNITVGGTGKTPLIAWMVEYFRDRGETPVVLSRGYGGSIRGPHRVVASDIFSQVGDEPLMLAQGLGVPVVIAKSRVAGAKFIEREKLGSVILLDDGFQHRWLARSYNIVCINVASESARKHFLQRRLLPWGIFRESLAWAIKRIDLVVFSERQMLSGRLDKRHSETYFLPSALPAVTSLIRAIEVVRAVDNAVLLPQEVQAICAIANPEGFVATLVTAGYQVHSATLLSDHSASLERQSQQLLALSTLPIVMTEKDYIKLSPALRSSQRIYFLKIQLEVQPRELLEKCLSAITNRD